MSPKPKRKASVLTEKQEKYVEGVLNNQTKTDAALAAGYAVTSVLRVEQSDDVRAALSSARSSLATATKTRREDVLEMFKRAYDLSELAGETASMVAAAREIGKMLGFYEPERIKLELSTSQAHLQQKFEIMSDAELLEIANGRAKVVEGEYVRLS